MEAIKRRAATLFAEKYGKEPEKMIFSPGRVNLIGEHIDYNGGRVLPCSLSIGTFGAACREEEGVIRLVSESFPDVLIETSVDKIMSLPEEPSCFSGFGWGAYPLGIVKKLADKGLRIGGFSMAVTGDLPNGSGLSSSASLEVLTCAVLNGLFGLGIDGVEAAKISLAAERDCVGVNCGIMDQFVCALGKKDHAILLDTASLDYEYIPFDAGDCVLLIMNTNKPRRLAESKYNERREECESALEKIKKISPRIKDLCGASPEDVEAAKAGLSENELKRARHAVSENRRTREAVEALGKGDMNRFGELLNGSHDSLREDYEVTGKELDSIVFAARAQEGVLGARMTGAGFGGCAIALVKKDAANTVMEKVRKIYKEETGYDCGLFMAETQDAPFAVK